MFILKSLHSSKGSDSAEDFLLKDSSLKMAYEFQVFHAIDIAQVTCSLIVPEWVEDLEFH
jgi:hypothetical protein